jgi:uncharacterized Zn-binding protein involved in type VI secretion
MMPCARITDLHVCQPPPLSGPILPPGVVTVLVGGLPAANVTTPTLCPMIAPAMGIIVKGSMTVLTGKLPQARVTDLCALGGMITVGMPTVLVGG